MERKLKILKAVLLLRRVNRYQSKEEQIAEAEKHYTDQQLDEWIGMLKHPEDGPESEGSLNISMKNHVIHPVQSVIILRQTPGMRPECLYGISFNQSTQQCKGGIYYMSYSTNMAGLDLFTVPFRNTQVSRTAAASRPQQPKATTSQLNSSVSPSQQPKSAAPQPVKPKAPAIQAQQPDIQHKSVPEEKTTTLQTGQDKSPEPEKKSQAEAQAPAKELPSAQAQSEPPAKELTMDMSDRTIPAGKPLDASEDAKRKAHEEA